MLLPSGALTLAKESGYRAVRITNLKLMAHIAQTAGRDPWLIRGDPWLIHG